MAQSQPQEQRSSLYINYPPIEKTDWLKDALPLQPVHSSLKRVRELVDGLFDDISERITVSSVSRQKEALKTVLLNLIDAYQMDVPVRYSRDKNRYNKDRKYGKLHFKYDRIIPAIDALETLGYIEQSSFFFDQAEAEGFQTRMWGTDKLIGLCREYKLTQYYAGLSEPFEDEETLILRDNKKRDIGYRETTKTRKMRDDLEQYNAFIDKHEVSVCLEGSMVIDNRFLTEDLFRNIEKGNIWIKQVRLNESSVYFNKPIPLPSFTLHNKLFSINPTRALHNLTDIIGTTPLSSITHTKRGRALLRLMFRRFLSNEYRFQRELEKHCFGVRSIPWKERQEVLDMEFPLQDLGADELVFVLEHNHLRRIFNKKSWIKGGRAYGGLYQEGLPKDMRRGILIDGQPTVELDYSGLHIRMLYHLKGMDYRGECYVYEKADRAYETERKRIKKANLIIINAGNRKEALNAVRNECQKDGIGYTENAKRRYEALLDTFQGFHEPIRDYLFSGKGIELQGIDSRIMASILGRMVERGIPALPVHDSVICPIQHQDFLRQVMEEEYEKVMGFKPVID